MKPYAYSGINLNYNATQTLAAYVSDLRAIQDSGVTRVRINIPTYTNSDKIALWRQVLQAALKMNFQQVIYGVTFDFNQSSRVINQANWPSYQNGVIAEATWLANPANISATDRSRIVFQIGNELERQRWCSITSITFSGTTATVKTPYAHGFTTGQTVYVRGVDQDVYNGSFAITVTNSTTFTFTTATTPAANGASAGTGWGVSDFSDAAFITVIRTMATNVAGVWSGSTVYSIPAGSPNQSNVSNTYPSQWASAGRGAITYLALNLYDSHQNFVQHFNEMLTAFGSSNFMLTEWNLDSNSSIAYAKNDNYLWTTMAEARLALAKRSGVIAYYYCYRDENNYFGARLTDGSYREIWSLLTGKRPTNV